MKARDSPVSSCGKVTLVTEIISIHKHKNEEVGYKSYKDGRHKNKGKSDLAIKISFFGEGCGTF